MFAKQPKLDAEQLIRNDDVACVRVTAPETPMACQYDGEYLGLRGGDDVPVRSGRFGRGRAAGKKGI